MRRRPTTFSVSLIYDKGPFNADVNWDYTSRYTYVLLDMHRGPGVAGHRRLVLLGDGERALPRLQRLRGLRRRPRTSPTPSRGPTSTAILCCRGRPASPWARARAAWAPATARTAAASSSAPRTDSRRDQVPSVTTKPWLIYALVTTGFWGVWGAFAEFPTRHGFPDTLVYVVWALTMIPPALYAMRRVGWKVSTDGRSVFLGSLIGLTGAGGQMLLFHAVHTGPTYLIFPIIALVAGGHHRALIAVPEGTGEQAGRARRGAGADRVAAVQLLAGRRTPRRRSAQGVAWFLYALIILLAWGVQAYFMKLANAP